VLILYAAHVIGGQPCPGDDATEVRFFGPTEIPTDIAFDSHRLALGQWASARAINYGLATPQQTAAVAEMAAGQELAIDGPGIGPARAAQTSLVVATDGQDIVGFLCAVYDPSEGVLRLQQVYVRPSYRRWGIGTRLVHKAQEIAARHGAHRLLAQVPADNPGLIMFIRADFEVCGFLRQGRRSVLFLGQELPGPSTELLRTQAAADKPSTPRQTGATP